MPQPFDRNTDPSLLYVILAILVIIGVNILSRCGILPTVNDVTKTMLLQELETAFDTVQHPEQTARVDLQKTIGRLTDQSQGCDLFIGEVRSYSGVRDQIVTVYTGQTVQDYGELGVIFIEDKTIPAADHLNLPVAFDSLSQWKIASASLEQPLYLVYLFIRDYNPATRIECP